VVVACTLTGLVALLPFGSRHSTVDQYLPAFALPWYVGLLVAGVTCLTSAVWPTRTIQGLSRLLGLERVGLAVLAGLLGGYGGALEVVAPRSPSGIVLLALMIASIGRIWQVAREIRSLHELVQTLGHVAPQRRETPPLDLPPVD
jgi:hypothetical protein